MLRRRLRMLLEDLGRRIPIEREDPGALDRGHAIRVAPGRPAVVDPDTHRLLRQDLERDHGVVHDLGAAEDVGLRELRVVACAAARERVGPGGGLGELLDQTSRIGGHVQVQHLTGTRVTLGFDGQSGPLRTAYASATRADVTGQVISTQTRPAVAAAATPIAT